MMLNSFNDMDPESFSLGDFETVIKKFNLKPDFTLSRKKNKIIINEIWSSKKIQSISANRIYEFDVFFIELIPEQIRKQVLEEVLQIYVGDERYEEAAEVRDEILKLD